MGEGFLNELGVFDDSIDLHFDEYEVSQVLGKYVSEDDVEFSLEFSAELMAFQFSEGYHSKYDNWGTYFGPMFSRRSEDGSIFELPTFKNITHKTVDYWSTRASVAKHPILVARYSGLVWDLQVKVSGIRPDYSIGKTYVRALIDISVLSGSKREIYVFDKLRRALEVSIGMNDLDLIELCKKALLSYEDRVSVDTKPGLWGHSYDLLVGNKKVGLSELEETRIIEELEEKLIRLTDDIDIAQNRSPWVAESAANRLAKYYSKKKRYDDVQRVLLKVGQAYEVVLNDAPSIQASGWAMRLYKLYKEFKLKEQAEQLLLKIRDIGPNVNAELGRISQSIDIPKENINAFTTAITTGTVDEFLVLFANQFLPIKEMVREQLNELKKIAPIQFLLNHSIQDYKGRIVATIGSIDSDLEGRIVKQISDNMHFSSVFVHFAIEKAKEKYLLNKEQIIRHLQDRPAFANDRLPIIELALDSYFRGEYAIFIHLLIPQIEEGVRNIVEHLGSNVLKESRSGGSFQLKNFDEILRDENLSELVGEDFPGYFRVLFTDQRGWNLRNDVAHGLANPKVLNRQTSDRLLHALLCLGMIVWTEK